MSNKRNILIYIAIVGLVLALALMFVDNGQRNTLAEDTNLTSKSVDASVKRLLPTATSSTNDPALAQAVQSLAAEPYVAWVWLVDANGEILAHDGGPGEIGDNVRSWDQPNEALAYLTGLQPGSLSTDQELQLVALGAMRSEGEHNDVFRQKAYRIADENGQIQAVLVVAYDVSPKVGNPGTAYILGVLAWLGAVSIYWLFLPLWVYFDARARGESAALWGLFVLFTNLVGLLAYLIGAARPTH